MNLGAHQGVLIAPMLVLGVLALEVGRGSAQDVHPARPLTGRALVYLEADEGVDEFVRVFLFEVVAGRLRDHGLAVFRGEPTTGSRPMACLRDVDCVRALQRAHSAPLVIALHIARADDRVLLTWRRSDAVADRASRIEDSEGGVAAALAQALMQLEIASVPCVVVLESGLEVTLSLDDVEVQTPALVASGEHLLRAVAAGREAWSGSLRCRGGRVLRVAIR